MSAISSEPDEVEFEDLRVGRSAATYRDKYVPGVVGLRLRLARVLVGARGLPVTHAAIVRGVWGIELREETDAGVALLHALHEMVSATRPALLATHLDFHAVYGVGYRIGARTPNVKKARKHDRLPLHDREERSRQSRGRAGAGEGDRGRSRRR